MENLQNKKIPTIHVISDSVGETAKNVAMAAWAQFSSTPPKVEVFARAKSFQHIKEFLLEHMHEHLTTQGDERLLVFFTLVSPEMREGLQNFIDQNPSIYCVDLLTNAIIAIQDISGLEPVDKPGLLRNVDNRYYKRIEAIEFTIAHDDGRRPEDLTHADIVIIGVSRTSKTPTSIYLAQNGYSVANIPKELEFVDKTRLFGLMSTPEVLNKIRSNRMSNLGAQDLEYTDIENIFVDLEKAREYMRKLGCIVIHTDGRAIEETASEILRYYHTCHQ